MGKLVGKALVVVLVFTSLTGCAFSDPRIFGTPASPSANPALTSDQAQAATQIQQAWAALAGLATLDPTTPRWAAMADTLKAQWLVLVGPDPINRVSALNVDIGAANKLATIQDGTDTANDTLQTARDSFLAQAKQATGTTAAFWASLACSAEQIRQGIGGTYNTATPANQSATIQVVDEKTAVSNLISSYDEGVFAMRSAMGFLDPGATGVQSRYQTVLGSLLNDASSLATVAQGMGITQDTSPPIYQLPPGRDSDASLALLASTQTSLIQASAQWVASANDPTQAITYMMNNATVGMPLGVGMAVWPGWPDS
ncbi:MAG: hypothetical protein FWF25_08760 [Propionibacteriaceae bacterium]|nr:hypothetical protein [Propionibacteriaceae bacterium]